MGIFDMLAEMRINEWQKRSANRSPEEQAAPVDSPVDETLEVQLYKEILQLREHAQEPGVSGEERDLFMTKAGLLETQLMVLLENSGRPLAARNLAENIRIYTKYSPKGP